MLDELAAVPGVRGVMLTFDDFVIGMEQFGTRILPLDALSQRGSPGGIDWPCNGDAVTVSLGEFCGERLRTERGWAETQQCDQRVGECHQIRARGTRYQLTVAEIGAGEINPGRRHQRAEPAQDLPQLCIDREIVVG